MKMMLRKAPVLLQIRFILPLTFTVSSPSPQSLHHLLHRHLYLFSFSSTSEESKSFTVSYLINSCALSHKDALSASKQVHFETPEKPNSVLAFFNNQGFSKTQISKIVKVEPKLLLYNPEKTLLPKLRFFYSKGASLSDVAKISASWPGVLTRSLENRIIPSFHFLRDFLQSDERTIAAVKGFSRIIQFDLDTYMASNIKALQEFGVPYSNIAGCLLHFPAMFTVRPNVFRENLEEVKKMGLNPSMRKFVVAVKAIRAGGESCRERKIDLYKKWGWSEEDIRLAFDKSPWIMVYSEVKIMATMDFFVNEMGRDSSLIAHHPILLGFSMEKRIIPRYSVAQVLLSKGLIKKDFSLSALFKSSEKEFLQKFVYAHKDEAPQLLKLYEEKLNLSKK